MGVYTNQALKVVHEAGLAKEYDKVPGYFLTSMFYGHAQVLVDAGDFQEAKKLERLALGDFMTFKDQINKAGNVIKESEATKVVIHNDNGVTRIDVIDDRGEPVQQEEIVPAPKIVDPEDQVQQRVQGDEPVVDVPAPEEDAPTDSVVASPDDAPADDTTAAEDFPGPEIVTQEDLENGTVEEIGNEEDEDVAANDLVVRSESYVVKEGKLFRQGYYRFSVKKYNA